jgi:PAS domain S-box-containing protein
VLMNTFPALFSSESLLPHGFCYLWNPLLIWLHGLSDTLIAIAYFSIPPTLIYLVRKKRSIPFDWMFVFFGCFIAACGATHLMEVVTLWTPMYWISGAVKVITAFASLPTAILLARVVPQILEMPTAQEMRLAHEELEVQARILREQAALIDLSQDAILVQTIDGENLLWNQGAEHMYGWTKAEAIRENGHKLVEANFPRSLEEILDRLEKTGHWEGEVQKKRRDGQTLLVSSRWALGRDADGRPEKILVIDTDITEQRRAGAALRESEDRYRDLVEHSLDLICTHDLQGRLLSVNELPTKILGYSRGELIKRPMKDFLLKEGHASFDEYLVNIQRTGVAKGAMVVLTKSGEHRIWEYQNSLRTDGVTTPVVRGIAHDVTEQRLAERALRQSEERFRLMAENIDEIFWLLDPKSLGAIYVNPAFEHICERTMASLYARPTSYQEIIHPEDAPHVLAQLALLEQTNEFHEQFRILCPSGTKWVEVWGFTAKDSLGKVTALVGTAQDITERRRAEDGLQELSGRLLQLQDDERRKIARDLHDVTGQDLVALSSTLGHLHTSVSSSSRGLRKSLSQCQGLADRCIREVRTLSYLLHPPMLDEAGLEDAIRHYVSGFAERTGIEVKLEISSNFGRLPREQEMALFRVMQESLVNIHRHSGSPSATILLRRTPRRVLLEMRDQGCGIQGNGRGRIKGVSFAGGVGIQSMRERMKQVRGQLDIESGPSGTTVRAMVAAHEQE